MPSNNIESLTTVSNINSEIYHDQNSFSDQINQSKLDLQKIMNDKNILPYPHHNLNANNVSTTSTNTTINNENNNNNNTIINNKNRSSSTIKSSNSKIHSKSNDELSSDDQQHHHLFHHRNNDTYNKKSHHAKSILKSLINHTDIPKSQNNHPELDINNHLKSSATALKPVITPGPSIMDKNGSLIRSELESSSSFSSFNSSTSLPGIHSLNNNNNDHDNNNNNNNDNTTNAVISNSIIDVFLVTKPKKVGLNILNQHIEYAVTARKFGEKDIVSYKRYSDFVKLRDHLYSLCQDRSKSNKKKKKKIRNSSNSFKRSAFNLKKRDMKFDEKYIGYPPLDTNTSMSKKEKRRSTTSLEINKLIKAFGGTGIHDDIENNNGYTGEDVSLDHPSLNSDSSDDEDEMAIANKILPPFPQKKIVGKFNSAFIEKRRESLQSFLNDILMEPSLEFLIPTIQQWIMGELNFQ